MWWRLVTLTIARLLVLLFKFIWCIMCKLKLTFGHTLIRLLNSLVDCLHFSWYSPTYLIFVCIHLSTIVILLLAQSVECICLPIFLYKLKRITVLVLYKKHLRTTPFRLSREYRMDIMLILLQMILHTVYICLYKLSSFYRVYFSYINFILLNKLHCVIWIAAIILFLSVIFDFIFTSANPCKGSEIPRDCLLRSRL